MQITGHKSQRAHVRYDRSIEAQVRVAQRCARDDNLSKDIVREKTDLFKEKIMSGTRSVAEEDDTP